ncbi:MAG: universal stress protein [Desulfobacteraceae bacterium]|nr:universal stress protein [Desulfobacteraceae bacterium]
MIKRILVGLGGTPFTKAATQWATELGDLHQAQLTGVTIVNTKKLENVGPVPAGASAYAQRMREKKIKVSKEGTEEAISMFKEHCSNQQDPDKAIIKLLRNGVRPILAVAEKYRPVQNVVVAISGSMESAQATRDFLLLNPWPKANIRFVHFKHHKEPEPFLLEKASDYCQAHGFEVHTEIVEGNPRYDLLSYAHDHQADLIVMGNSSQNIIKRSLLGDTVLETIHSADIPLFLSQ